LSCYVSLCSEFRVGHFIICFCVVLLCFFMFWVRVAHFFSFFLCWPIMCLYVLSSVLLISIVFLFSCYVSLCSEFRVAHFFSFFVLSCYVSLCSVFRVAHFFSFYVSSCYVSLCSVFRVAHFFSFFALSCYLTTRKN
jgi:hypothetical protein